MGSDRVSAYEGAVRCHGNEPDKNPDVNGFEPQIAEPNDIRRRRGRLRAPGFRPVILSNFKPKARDISQDGQHGYCSSFPDVSFRTAPSQRHLMSHARDRPEEQRRIVRHRIRSRRVAASLPGSSAILELPSETSACGRQNAFSLQISSLTTSTVMRPWGASVAIRVMGGREVAETRSLGCFWAGGEIEIAFARLPILKVTFCPSRSR